MAGHGVGQRVGVAERGAQVHGRVEEQRGAQREHHHGQGGRVGVRAREAGLVRVRVRLRARGRVRVRVRVRVTVGAVSVWCGDRIASPHKTIPHTYTQPQYKGVW